MDDDESCASSSSEEDSEPHVQTTAIDACRKLVASLQRVWPVSNAQLDREVRRRIQELRTATWAGAHIGERGQRRGLFAEPDEDRWARESRQLEARLRERSSDDAKRNRGLFRVACYLHIRADRARFAASSAGKLARRMDDVLQPRKVSRARRRRDDDSSRVTTSRGPASPRSESTVTVTSRRPRASKARRAAQAAAAAVIQLWYRVHAHRKRCRAAATNVWNRVVRRATQRSLPVIIARSEAAAKKAAEADRRAALKMQCAFRRGLARARLAARVFLRVAGDRAYDERLSKDAAWLVTIHDRCALERMQLDAIRRRQVFPVAPPPALPPRNVPSPVLDVLRAAARKPRPPLTPTVANIFEVMCSGPLVTDGTVSLARRMRKQRASSSRLPVVVVDTLIADVVPTPPTGPRSSRPPAQHRQN